MTDETISRKLAESSQAGRRLSALGYPGYSEEFSARVLALVERTGCSALFAIESVYATDRQLRWMGK